ncbi:MULTISPECIES: TetR/AcrR family transcriptional regulator [unclassified Sphingobium]|uniref:TetR/AcrR family transcriptional regulator n=1 Tax=unclassified Sphingobium TaxID=2611147 RepID=UPI000D16AF05|nr:MULTISPECIES: TetR/AcrR family transcriptional regulator [unclassified Sphingobium]PSO13095.1 TetR/AcrR family transcriptional regulator [Sphingobium sp. AEW4]
MSVARPSRRNASAQDPRSRETTDRIMDAAERLFGLYGIDGVSMRQITAAAGVSNNSAIAYHFGDRDGLIRHILRQRLPTLEPRRRELLDRVLADGGGEADALAATLVLPVYELVDQTGRRNYAAFLRQILRSPIGRDLRSEYMELSPASATAFAAFYELFPDVPRALFRWRLRAATGLFFDLVFDRDCEIAAGRASMDEAAFLDEAIAMMVACCAAPLGRSVSCR